MTDTKKAIHRKFEGEVMSAKGTKTLQVLVKTRKMHAKYKKQYWESRKYSVHDEKEMAQVGDTIAFIECRPVSKTKRWALTSVVKKAV
ncbi:30S ribosomal protein S17 [Candidatus Parcubacteria bacterium]|nr:MAG: 30S ribosomal protein S17 [Candidatus Parcubacteria bacterium]